MSQTLIYNDEGDDEIPDDATIQGVQNQFVQSTDEAVCEQPGPGPGPIRKSNRQLETRNAHFTWWLNIRKQ